MSYAKDRLFIESEEDYDISKYATDLGKDTNLWLQKVKSVFEQELAPLIRAGGKPFINFTKKDFVLGTAVGGVTITVGGRILLFPIEIKDNTLSPFDNYYDQKDKKWHYLTEQRLHALANSYDPYKGITNDDISDTVQSDNTMDRNVSWRDPLTDHRVVTASYMHNIAELLSENPDMVINAELKVAEYLTRCAKHVLEQPQIEKSAEFIDRFADYDTALIVRKDIDSYKVKLASYGRLPYPEYINANANGIRALADSFGKEADKMIEDIDELGCSIVTRGNEMPGRTVSTHLDENPRQYPGAIGSFGTYEVTFDNGTKDVGVVYPVRAWDKGEDTGLFIFVSPENFSISRKLLGKRVSENMVLPKSTFVPDITGVFIKNSEGLAFATWPVKIESVSSSPEAAMQIKAVETRHLVKLHLVITDAVKYPMLIDPDVAPELIIHDRVNVYIPQDMIFTPLPAAEDVKVAMTLEGAFKTADILDELTHQGGILKVSRHANDRFRIYEKKASFVNCAHPVFLTTSGLDEADFLLKTAGIDARQDLSGMVLGEEMTVFIPGKAFLGRNLKEFRKVANLNIDEPEVGIEFKPDHRILIKLANIVESRVLDLSPVFLMAENPDDEIWKEAQEQNTDDSDSINSILNLNFLGKENVDYFLEHLDAMQEVEDVLTRLLVVSRMSNLGINPDDVKDALRGITATKEKFEQVRRLRLQR